MPNDVTSLKRALVIAEKIQALESELSILLGGSSAKTEGGSTGGEVPSPFKAVKRRKRSKMSKAGREKIAAAQRARWAKVKAAKKG